jgi:hypothetical protein
VLKKGLKDEKLLFYFQHGPGWLCMQHSPHVPLTALLLQHGGAFGPVLQAMQCGAWLFGFGAVGTVFALAAWAYETATATRRSDRVANMRSFCFCTFLFHLSIASGGPINPITLL